MNRRISAILQQHVAIFLLGFVAAGCASARIGNRRPDHLKEQVAIERRLQEIFAAAESKDLERLDRCHAYGPKFTKYSGTSAERRDAAASRQGEHDGLAALQGLKMHARDLKIDVFGNVGIATFILDYHFDSAGETVYRKDRSTLVFCNDQGDWKIVHEHLTPIQP